MKHLRLLSVFMSACLAACGGGGGGSSTASGTEVELIPPNAQTFSFSEFQIDSPYDSLVVHSMSFSQNLSGIGGGAVTISFSLYKLGKPEIEQASFTGKWDKVVSNNEFAITIDGNALTIYDSKEILFEAVELKLQALNFESLPASCNAQFTDGSISIKVDNKTYTFDPIGETVEIQYIYGE